MENRGWNGKIVNSTLQFKTRNKKRKKKKKEITIALIFNKETQNSDKSGACSSYTRGMYDI